MSQLRAAALRLGDPVVLRPDGHALAALNMERVGKKWSKQNYVYFGGLKLHKPDQGLKSKMGAGGVRGKPIRCMDCPRCGVRFASLPHMGVVDAPPGKTQWSTSQSYRSECFRCQARPSMTDQKRAAYDWAKTQPCTDCGGVFHPGAMEFDHLPEFVKVDDLSTLVRTGTMRQFTDEIAKCEIVCANCHRVRTDERRT